MKVKTSTAVFVDSIKKNGTKLVIEANNGSSDGPPAVIFQIDNNGLAANVKIGTRFLMTLEELT